MIHPAGCKDSLSLHNSKNQRYSLKWIERLVLLMIQTWQMADNLHLSGSSFIAAILYATSCWNVRMHCTRPKLKMLDWSDMDFKSLMRKGVATLKGKFPTRTTLGDSALSQGRRASAGIISKGNICKIISSNWHASSLVTLNIVMKTISNIDLKFTFSSTGVL